MLVYDVTRVVLQSPFSTNVMSHIFLLKNSLSLYCYVYIYIVGQLKVCHNHLYRSSQEYSEHTHFYTI